MGGPVLIVGGAYQGKLEYAIEAYRLKPEAVQHFTEEGQETLDFEKKAYNGLDRLILRLIRRGEDPVAYIKDCLPLLQDKIVIVNDISQGVVPMDPELRQWREQTGRILALVSKEASRVVRLFVGIPEVLK